MAELAVTMRLLAPSEVTDGLRQRLKESEPGPVVIEDTAFLRRGGHVFSCPADETGLAMLRAMSEDNAESTEKSAPVTLEETYRFLMLNTPVPEQAQELVRAFGLRETKARLVLLFQQESSIRTPLGETLRELAPAEPGECLVPLQPETVALIRDAAGREPDEAMEYARAVLEMAEAETGLQLWAGIGLPVKHVDKLSESYRQAEEAVRLGRAFGLPDFAFSYDQMMMEQLLTSIPEELRNQALKKVFTPKVENMLDSETLETLHAFLNSDLSMTVTARQLYTHRNTIIYRLDRLRKATGLDVRRFRDAALFQILLALREYKKTEDVSSVTRKGGLES